MVSEQAGEVLLIEDNEFDLELTLRAFVAEAGQHRIRVARDGVEVLEMMGRWKPTEPTVLPRLVLLDLKLPPTDGVEVLREIKRNTAWRGVPVVVLSSSNRSEDIKNAYLAGANSYLQKPVTFGEFRQLVSRLEEYWLRLNQTPRAQGFKSTSEVAVRRRSESEEQPACP